MLSEDKNVSLKENSLGEISLLADMKKDNLDFVGLKIGLRSLEYDMGYVERYLDDFFKDNHAISLIDQSVFGENF